MIFFEFSSKSPKLLVKIAWTISTTRTKTLFQGLPLLRRALVQIHLLHHSRQAHWGVRVEMFNFLFGYSINRTINYHSYVALSNMPVDREEDGDPAEVSQRILDVFLALVSNLVWFSRIRATLKWPSRSLSPWWHTSLASSSAISHIRYK